MDKTNSTTKSPRGGFKSVRPGERGGAPGAGGRPNGRGGNRDKGSFVREKPEFEQKILAIRRVTRVVAGGRRMSFSVAMAIGDKKGSIGFGIGKAGDTALAINKALRVAKKNMLRLKTTKTMSIPHEVEAKFCSSSVMLMPNKGRGMVCGSTIRDMLILGGIKDVTAKIHSGSKNKLNNAQATMKALSLIAHPHRLAVALKEDKIETVMPLEEGVSVK